MRKIMMLLTLATAYVAVSASAGTYPPPQCAPNCPFVR